MNAVIGAAAGGMAVAAARFGEAAGRAAGVDTGAAGTGLPDAVSVDLTGAALDMIASRAGFFANAAVLKTADAMQKRLLDIRS